jgi:hypothetical protein
MQFDLTLQIYTSCGRVLAGRCITCLLEFVHTEIREALRLGRKLLTFHEVDPRFHAINFEHERNQSPEDLKLIFDDYESIPCE